MQRNRTEEARKRAEERADQRKKVSIVLKRLIGDRSIRKTAVDTGVTAAYLSGILNEKYLPSREVLEKLAAPENMPQNDVTLDELLTAAGYISQAERSEKSDAELDMIINGISGGPDQVLVDLSRSNNTSNQKEAIARLQAYEKRLNAISQFSTLANAVIYTALIKKGIFGEELKDISAKVKGIDFGVKCADSKAGLETRGKTGSSKDNRIDEWWFILGYYDEETSYLLNEDLARTRGWFLNALFVEKNPRRKISVVTNSEKAFGNMMNYKEKMAYQGELSIILIDTESISVKNEVYLAHYSEEGRSKEILLAGES
jgi:transcriptional regulator with XRE-family HTH domain